MATPDNHSLNQALIRATQHLKSASIESPRREARLLAAFALNLSQSDLLLRGDETFDLSLFNSLLQRRKSSEPLAYLIGSKGFWKHDFIVTKHTLIPRPETELLVEHAISLKPKRVLDLGTGSGAILLSILSDCKSATGLGTDISNDALTCAVQNAQSLNLSDRAAFVLADWAQNLTGPFDVILSNPPYISASEYQTLDPTVRHFEPKSALVPTNKACDDGLSAYRIIAAQIPDLLSPNGTVLFEIGTSQAKAVGDILTANAFTDIQIMQDLAGHDRCIIAKTKRHINT